MAGGNRTPKRGHCWICDRYVRWDQLTRVRGVRRRVCVSCAGLGREEIKVRRVLLRIAHMVDHAAFGKRSRAEWNRHLVHRDARVRCAAEDALRMRCRPVRPDEAAAWCEEDWLGGSSFDPGDPPPGAGSWRASTAVGEEPGWDDIPF